jgi:hypothetical protein
MDTLTSNVVVRFAATHKLDLAWVEGLRKDFLTLLKNLPKIKDYKTAHTVKQAFQIYRNRFDAVFFEAFLNKSLKEDPKLANHASYINDKLRSVAWEFSSDLRLPVGHQDEYYTEGARFVNFEREYPQWKVRVQRKAQVFWKAMKDVIEYLQRVHGDLETDLPTVENATIEGFKLVMNGFKPDDEHNQQDLETLKAGLSLYRKRAGMVAPILLRKQLPVVCEFKSTLDKGGEYNSAGYINLYMSSVSKGPSWVAHVMAHEMGHHIWKSYLAKEAQDFWYQTIKGDYGDLDLKELLDKWPEGAWSFDFTKYLGDSDPILALQVESIKDDHLNTKEDFQKLYDRGERKIRVPKTPITGYADKNPEEAFCEAIGLLVAYGPRAVHEKVRWWLDTAMPGAVKVASSQIEARVLGRFLADSH